MVQEWISMHKDTLMEIWKTQVRWNLNVKKGSKNYDGRIYDADTGEIYVEPEQKFHMLLIEYEGTEKKGSLWYECDTKLVENAFDEGIEIEKECRYYKNCAKCLL
mgnify:CR=1 FL=1